MGRVMCRCTSVYVCAGFSVCECDRWCVLLIQSVVFRPRQLVFVSVAYLNPGKVLNYP